MKAKIISLLFILIFLGGCALPAGEFGKDYVQGLKYEYQGHYLKQAGITDYEQWRLYFESSYFTESIPYCENARYLFTEAINNFDRAYISYEKTYVFKNELIPLKLEYLNLTKDITWNNYEACEYYETASRHYANGNKEAGDIETEMANTKIREHDSMITKVSLLATRIEVLEE